MYCLNEFLSVLRMPGTMRTTGLVLSILMVCNASAAQWSYLLQAGDSVAVAVYGRADLSGAYRLDESGAVRLPLVGEVSLIEKTTEQASKAIASSLSQRIEGELQVNVSMVEYQPYYIDGDVVSPGSYAYRPGLRVSMAVAVAGGRFSLRSSTGSSLIGRSNEQERMDVMLDEYWANVAIEARLLAELKGDEEITFPADLLAAAERPRVAEILSGERDVLASRREAFNDESADLELQLVSIEEQARELDAQKLAVKRREGLLKGQFTDIRKLVGQGVVPKSTLLQLELSTIGIEQEMRSIALAIIQSKQALEQTKGALRRLRSSRRSAILVALQQVRDRLARSRLQLDLIGERVALLETGAPPGPKSGEDAEAASYTLERGGETLGLNEVDGNTEVRPGDVIRVPFPKFTGFDRSGLALPQRSSPMPP